MWQPGWEGSLGEKGYMYTYGRSSSLFPCNCHGVICQMAIPQHKITLFVKWLSVQFSHLVTPDSLRRQACLFLTNSQSLLKVISTELVMPSNHPTLCHPLFLPPSIFPCIRVFPNESVLPIRWPKYWSFSFSLRPCNEYSGLISFRIDWLDLLAV